MISVNLICWIEYRVATLVDLHAFLTTSYIEDFVSSLKEDVGFGAIPPVGTHHARTLGLAANTPSKLSRYWRKTRIHRTQATIAGGTPAARVM
jgi:hypothetical protein